jgi:hypothetical protein
MEALAKAMSKKVNVFGIVIAADLLPDGLISICKLSAD